MLAPGAVSPPWLSLAPATPSISRAGGTCPVPRSPRRPTPGAEPPAPGRSPPFPPGWRGLGMAPAGWQGSRAAKQAGFVERRCRFPSATAQRALASELARAPQPRPGALPGMGRAWATSPIHAAMGTPHSCLTALGRLGSADAATWHPPGNPPHVEATAAQPAPRGEGAGSGSGSLGQHGTQAPELSPWHSRGAAGPRGT